MKAHDLIASIFARVQDGVPGNVRRITRAQLGYLRNLIDQDEEGGAVQSGGPGVTVWKPSGRNKYILTEDLRGERHTLTRVANIAPSSSGLLF